MNGIAFKSLVIFIAGVFIRSNLLITELIGRCYGDHALDGFGVSQFIFECIISAMLAVVFLLIPISFLVFITPSAEEEKTWNSHVKKDEVSDGRLRSKVIQTSNLSRRR